MTFTRRYHAPPGELTPQTQPGLLHGLGGQHGVIDTAKLHANHQNDRKPLGLCSSQQCSSSDSGVNQPPAPSTSTQSACVSRTRNPEESTGKLTG